MTQLRQRAWVVGAGGMLGARLDHALAGLTGAPCFTPAERFVWRDAPTLARQIERSVAEFATALGPAAFPAPYILAWTAGSGVIGTSVAELDAETAALAVLLDALDRHLGDRPGVVFFASSAGGIYGGSTDAILTEHTTCAPRSDYGRNKLRQEELVRAHCETRSLPLLIGRIANLYGPGQKLDKPQGFVSQLSRCLVFGVPVHVYVSLDTLRDFYFVDDCAAHIALCITRLIAVRPSIAVVKIFASQSSVSLAHVIALTSRVSRQKPRVVCAARGLGAQQATILRFRSGVWRDLAPPRQTDLLIGIHRVHEHQLMLHRLGLLRAPATA